MLLAVTPHHRVPHPPHRTQPTPVKSLARCRLSVLPFSTRPKPLKRCSRSWRRKARRTLLGPRPPPTPAAIRWRVWSLPSYRKGCRVTLSFAATACFGLSGAARRRCSRSWPPWRDRLQRAVERDLRRGRRRRQISLRSAKGPPCHLQD